MKRLPFVLRFRTGKREEGRAFIQANWARAKEALAPLGAGNLSVWGVGDFALCYGEYADETTPRQLQAVIDRAMRAGLDAYCELFAAPGTLPLMYHDIGVVREDKSLIRHRVFATHLKPGCAEEYKRRHDALIAARGDKITEGPESNFTIWNANGYIFGYCELVRAYDHEMTADERASTIAWETRQLEIMDWLTDDVDWMTGEHHEHIACLAIG